MSIVIGKGTVVSLTSANVIETPMADCNYYVAPPAPLPQVYVDKRAQKNLAYLRRKGLIK